MQRGIAINRSCLQNVYKCTENVCTNTSVITLIAGEWLPLGMDRIGGGYQEEPQMFLNGLLSKDKESETNMKSMTRFGKDE